MQRWQTPSDTWQLCLELLLCSPRSPAQHRPGGRGAGGWPAFGSRPREGVWSSAVSAAATPSRAPQQEGTPKAACSLTPLEKPGSVAGPGRAWQEETIHLTPHITQLGLSVSGTTSSSSAAREASSLGER